MTFRFPLATTTWDEAEYAAIDRVVKSGMFTMGPHVAQFERDFARYVGGQYAVMVNSGSSANLLMTAALFFTSNPAHRLHAGDEIIVPAVSWATTYYPLHQYGLIQKVVDIDLLTLNYDLDALEQAITPATRAIMVVNLLGNPNDFERIQAIAAGRDVRIIEDNCESLGARYQGRSTGTFGIMGSFSAFFSHHISTMEGGIVVTDDEELYHILLSLRAHGWTRNLPQHNRITGTKSNDPFEESFHFVLPGYNVRPVEMSGAIGIEQVKKLPQMVAARRDNGRRLQERLRDHPQIMIQQEIGESSWFGFSLVIRPGSELARKDLLTSLTELGFDTRPIVAGNFTKNPVFKYMNVRPIGALPNAEYVDANGLFVGNHHFPISEAIEALGSIGIF